jgi:hypothetical protein
MPIYTIRAASTKPIPTFFCQMPCKLDETLEAVQKKEKKMITFKKILNIRLQFGFLSKFEMKDILEYLEFM